MKLGTKILIVGLIVTAAGLSMDAGRVETSLDCSGPYWQACQERTEFIPNPLKPLFTFVGGVMVTGGFGGWIGTVDVEARQRRREAEAAFREQKEEEETEE